MLIFLWLAAEIVWLAIVAIVVSSGNLIVIGIVTPFAMVGQFLLIHVFNEIRNSNEEERT